MAGQPPVEQTLTEAQQQRASAFLTTEHFTLETKRAGTISEANGRSSTYLTVVSSALVALAFVAQISPEAHFFVIFGLITLPIVIFLGITTYTRLVQLNLADVAYTQAINRIRRFYLDTVPEAALYFTASSHDDLEGVLHSLITVRVPPVTSRQMAYQQLVSSAGQVLVVNSFIMSVWVGLAASFANFALWSTILVSSAAAVLGYLLHQRIGSGLSNTIIGHMESRFPSPDEGRQ